MKELCVDGRIHHGRLAIIVSADPPRNIMRDSDIAVRAAGRVAVPPCQPRHHRPHHATTQLAEPLRPEVRVELVPRIAHRRQAVAQVARAPGTHDRLGAAMADADDKIEAIEGELLDGRREQRQVVAVVALHERQPLHERGVYRQAFDRRRHGPALVDQREQFGLRKPLAQDFEHLLAAAHAGQPVVHEREARLRH